MLCDYELIINGESHKFSSEKDLDNYIRQNATSLIDRTLLDVRYSKSASDVISDLEKLNTEAYKRLEVYRRDKQAYIAEMKASREALDGEVIPEYTDGYTSVLKYVWGMEDNRMQVFNRTKYAIEKAKEIRARTDVANLNKDQQDIIIKQELDDTFAFWDYTQEVGKGLHYIMDQVFHKYGDLDINLIREKAIQDMKAEDIPGLSIDGVTDEAFNGFIKSIKRVKKEIMMKNGGRMPKFFTEFIIEGETNLGEKIRGKIDLLVVNDDKSVDIYDLKITTKQYDSWDRDKKTATDYQLGFYKRMLEAKGIPANSISCKIIPVLVSDFTRKSATTENSINKLALQETLNVLPTEAESHRINSLINVSSVTLESPISDKVSDKLTKFFPVTVFNESIQKTAVERIKKDQVSRKNGKWIFKNKVQDILKVFDTEEELDEYLNTYYDELSKYQQDLVQSITGELAGELEKMNATEKSFASGYVNREFRVLPAKLRSMSNRALTNTFIDSNLETYRTQSGWKVLKSDDFINMGVIVLINTTTHELDIISITNGDLFAEVPLPKGDTILSNFYDKSVTEKQSSRMKSTMGNIEMIKLVSIADEILNDDNYKGYRLNNIRTLNPIMVKGQTQVDLSKVLDNYHDLCRINGFDSNSINTTQPYERILTLLNEISTYDKTAKFQALADSIDWMGNEESIPTKSVKIQRLLELSAKLETMYFPRGLSNNDQTIEAFLLRSTYQAIATISGLDLDLFNTEKYSKYGISNLKTEFAKRTFLNGTDLNTTDTLPIIKPIADKLTAANRKIREKYTRYKTADRKATKPFYNQANSLQANRVVNLHTITFENLFDKSEYGKKNLTVKDPWTDNSLNEAEKNYLKHWLTELNEWRYPGESIDELKLTGQYFEVPLLKASWLSKTIHGKNWFKSWKEDWSLDIANPKFALEGDTSVYVESEDRLNNMYNIFNASDHADVRAEMLAKGDPMQLFETNLEQVKDMYVFSKIRQQEYNKILPQIDSAIKALGVATYLTGKPSKEIVKFVTDYIKSAILDESLIGDNVKGLYKVISPIKSSASIAILGYNYVSGIKETVVGFYNLYTRAAIDSMFDKDKINIAQMHKAYTYVWKDALKQVNNITLMEYLNWKYGMANMDTNSLVERENYDKVQAFRFKGSLYWCNRAPDFLHRMTILIGYMIKYGCLEAYEFNGDEVKYNWKKDKRFEALAKGDKSHPEYNNQRALYNVMMEEFINHDDWQIWDEELQDYRALTMEDDLPEAFTQKEADRASQEANTMFGYMDHDTKSLFFKRGMGTVIGQFRTYLTAKKNQWFLKRDVYNDGKWAHLKDKDGNLLYFEHYTDENGNDQKRLTTKVTDDPYWGWEGKIMEGIFWSLVDTVNLFRQGKFKEVWSDPMRKRNLFYGLSDILMIALLTWLLYSMTKDEPIYKQNYYNRLAHRVINNARGDINSFQTLTGAVDFRFVAWDFWIKGAKDGWKVITGESGMANFLSNRFSVLRPSKYELKEMLGEDKK